MKSDKVYHVKFNGNEEDHYFGSLAAIYTVFTPEQIGCKVERLWACNIKPGNPYENKKCKIKQGFLVRKPKK